MSYDSRGLLRGNCTECPCIGYDGGEEMKKCIKCFHPPGKHKNITDVGGSTSTATSHFTASHTTPLNLGGGFHSSSAPTSNHYTDGLMQRLYQPSHYHHQPRQPQLPQCQANGCFNPVHCDPSLPEGLRAFTYCSPQCRDRYLLPIERVNLTVDLDSLKKKLQEVAAAEKRSPSSIQQRQPSYEHFSRVASSSSSPTSIGGGHVLGGSSSRVGNSSSTSGGGGHILGDYASRGSSSSSTSVGGGHVLGGQSSRVGSSSLTSGVGGHILGTSGRQAKEQRTSKVVVRKPKHENFGVLLSKTAYTSDKTLGFLIIGVVHVSSAYSELKEGKLRIFDVIESVNDKSCSDLLIPARDPQQCFDQHLKDRASVDLYLSRSISLPPISDLLTKAQRSFTHLIALRYSPSCSNEAYGLTLNSGGYRYTTKVVVGGRTSDTPAYDSGIEFEDEIIMCAVASAKAIGEVEEITSPDMMKFDEAQSAKKSIILMIRRLSSTKV